MLIDTKVQLISSDRKTFEVETRVIQESEILANWIEDTKIGMTKDTGTGTATIPLFNVSSKILTKVIDYCKYHVESKERSDGNQAALKEEIKQWDEDFCKTDYDTLVGLIQAARYLNVRSLHDLGCQTVADLIKKRTAEMIHGIFLKDYFTPEEEEKITGLPMD